MSTIRITKEFTFEMAHALHGYEGKCAEIHGHSYRLFVTVAGAPIADDHSPKSGMVVDYHDLKKSVQQHLIDRFDHALAVREDSLFRKLADDGISKNLLLLPFQPTCENLLIDFAAKIKNLLPDGVKLHHLKLRETATSYAEWFTSDNPDGNEQ